MNHFVTKIDTGGPATAAKIKVGDRILQVNGIPTYTMSHEMITAMFKSASVEQRPLRVTLGLKEIVPVPLKPDEFSVNESVTAIYAGDGAWYEATVIDVFPERNSVAVLYSGFEDDGPQEVETSCIKKGDGASANLPPYWVAAYTESNHEKYFYNTLTNETTWDRPVFNGTIMNPDELADLDADTWVQEVTPNAERIKYFDSKSFHTVFKLVVEREGEIFEIDAGPCEFGGTVPKEGLDLALHYDGGNPLGVAPMDEPSVGAYPPNARVCFVVERGQIPVSHKVLAAQDAGAACFILVNNDNDESVFNIGSPGDGTDLQVRIPVTNISAADGLDLIAAFVEGVPMSAKLIPVVPHIQVDPDDLPLMTSTVKIQKLGRKLNIKLAALESNFYMTEILEDGAVAAVGRVRDGAKIISIDGTPVVGMARDDVLMMLDSASLVLEVNNSVLLDDRQKEIEAEAATAARVPMCDIEGWPLDMLNTRCTVYKTPGQGTIRFIGELPEKGRAAIGVEMDEAVGKNNGEIKGRVYFTCEAEHGKLVDPKKVTLVDESGADGAPGAPGAPARPPVSHENSKPILKTKSSLSSGNHVSFGSGNEDEIVEKHHSYAKPFYEGTPVPHKVLEDFEGQEEDELSVKAGDIVMVAEEPAAGEDEGGIARTANGDRAPAHGMVWAETRDGSKEGMIPRQVVDMHSGSSGGGGGGGPTLSLFGGLGGGDSGDSEETDDMMMIGESGDDDETGHGPIRVCSITRSPQQKVGIKFAAYIEKSNVGAVIKSISAGSLADEIDGFEVGLQVVSINGTDTNVMNKKDVLKLIKECPKDGGKLEIGLVKPACAFLQLTKVEGKKLGMSFKETDAGLIISTIRPGGIASEHPKMKVGLRVVSVQDVDTTSASKAEVIELIKGAESVIDLTLSDPSVSQISSAGSGTPALAAIDPAATAPPKAAAAPTTPPKAAAAPTTQAVPRTPPLTVAGAGGVSEADFMSMGRLKLIGLLRAKGVDYKANAKDLDALRNLVRGLGGPASAGAAAAPANTTETGPSVFIKKISATGLAHESGGFEAGQQVVSINGENTRGSTKEELLVKLKALGPDLVFGLEVPAHDGHPASSTTATITKAPSRRLGIGLETRHSEVVPAPAVSEGPSGDVLSPLRAATANDAAKGLIRVQFSKQGRKIGVAMNSFDGQSYITKLTPEGAAAATGKIKVGFALMQVGGVDCAALDKSVIIEMLKAEGETITMHVKPALEGYAAFMAHKAEKKAKKVAAAGKTDVVRIDKSSGRKLGISMEDRPGDGVWITKVNPGGLGAEHPACKAGQKFMSVNGTDTSKATKAEVIALVKSNAQYSEFTFSSRSSSAAPIAASCNSTPSLDTSNPFAAPPASSSVKQNAAAPKKAATPLSFEAPKKAAGPKELEAPKKAAPKKTSASKKAKSKGAKKQPGLVRIDKTSGKKLGISMDGQPEGGGSGMFVTKITPTGLAAGYPECKVGAKISAVNGQDCTQATKKQVIALIKQNADYVDIQFT